MSKTIIKAKINGGALDVVYKEYNPENDFTNKYTVECPQVFHRDLQVAFDKLKPHVAAICEFPEGGDVCHESIDSIGDSMINIVVTGFTTGGSDESAGACITAQRILQSGKVLNLVTPFIQYDSEDYVYASELCLTIEACEYEVKEYLNGKFGIKQAEFDFDATSDSDIANAENTGEHIKVVTRKAKKARSVKKMPETAESF